MVTRRTLIKRTAGAGLLATPLLQATRAFAQEGTPVAAGTPADGLDGLIPEGCELVAGGLLSPRFMAFGADGSLYVTEAGTGGDEELYPLPVDPGTPTAENGTPTAANPIGVRGQTGRVSMISADGTVTTVADGLPSYLTEGPVGPAGIAVGADGQLLVAIGGPGPFLPLLDPVELENSVVSIDPATGEVTLLANIGQLEEAANPGGFTIDSNLYGLTLDADGAVVVSDAGGNVIYRINPQTNEPEVIAIIPGIAVSEDQAPEGGNPNRGGALELDPVPTSVAPAGSNGFFVSLLSGFPYPAGATGIDQVAGDGTVTTLMRGLTMATDVKVGPDGHLYVCQLSADFLQDVPAPGSVVRVLANGTIEPVVEGLMLPNGIAFDDQGNLFIAAGTVSFPGTEPMGMVLRCDGVATG